MVTSETPSVPGWRRFLPGSSNTTNGEPTTNTRTWTMGMLNPPDTIEVPGSVLLLSHDHNTPLGLRELHPRTSHSSLPTGIPVVRSPNTSSPPSRATSPPPRPVEKKTDAGIILNPQPEDSANDPLNWPSWRRDMALYSLGLYCMIGGGMTPILAAGFTDVAADYDMEVERVSLTTGLFMMGMGVGSVIVSPTAILYGKRPVYLISTLVMIATCVWCAKSPSFSSLLAARVFQGIAISPVECLPSATIAEIFFLHERAFRIGIYTLLLLGGKNIVPLVSAVVIQSLGWPWVFWIVACIVGFCSGLLFLFTPESFWDRTPVPRKRGVKRPGLVARLSSHMSKSEAQKKEAGPAEEQGVLPTEPKKTVHKNLHVGFAPEETPPAPTNPAPGTTSPSNTSYISVPSYDVESLSAITPSYTNVLREQPALSFMQQLRPWNGRLRKDKWWKVLLRPFILYTHPAILWSALVYSCSIGWLIVISESLAMIYRSEAYYNFTALQTGLVYISPFVGGVLGTAIAGRVSDIVVKAMTRRNGGLYEPEFRLVMVIPIAISTVAGLMAFGWAAEERDNYMVPTVFFGVVSFGCALGSTTSITFTVDSYRQYAGEALVTLNFSKNIFHGLVFSLFVTDWLKSTGPKMVFIWIGVIQLAVMATAVPMYIFGKRARLWTARSNLMERV